MKLSYYTAAFVLAVSFASCSAYQSAQMPDDLYYTKSVAADEYYAMNENAYDPEDSYIRSKVRNRQRFSAYNNQSMMGMSGMGMGLHPSFGFSRFGGFGGYGGFGFNNPFMWGSGLSMGWGTGWGSMFSPFGGFGYDPYMMGYHGMGMSSFGWGGMGYFGGYPLGMYGNHYPIGYYAGGKGVNLTNKPTRNFNANQYNRTGQYNNINSNPRANNFGSSMRNIFTAPPANSRVNSNYRGSTYERPTRSYTNPNTYSPNRNFPSNTGGSRVGGGSVGGSSSGGGGGISRPSRN